MALLPSRFRAAIAILFLLPLAAAAGNPTGDPSLSSSGLAVKVSGHQVIATTMVKASAVTTVAKVGVCVRGADESNFDFIKSQNVQVSTSGYRYT